MSASVASFRARYRGETIPRSYSGLAHVAVQIAVPLATLAYTVVQLHHVTALEYLTLPGAAIFLNLFEYVLHRWPLHHSWPGAHFMYRIHAQEHHRFFEKGEMRFDTSRDWHIVFFPPWAPLALMALGYVVGASTLGVLVSQNSAWLFLSTVAVYFLLYEGMHFSHHLHARDGRAGLFAWMRQHHEAHHDLERMTECNFNVTFPLSDWLFGTLRR